MGVPAVVRPLGSTQERVIDGVTGHVAEDDEGFAAAAVRLLRDDELWRRWHRAALARQRGMSWDAVGARFELWPIASRGELPSRRVLKLIVPLNRTSLSSGLQEPSPPFRGEREGPAKRGG